MKKTIYNTLRATAILAVASLSACADRDDAFNPAEDADRNIPENITLTLSMPDFTADNIGRAVDENALNSITVLGYDASGNKLSNVTYSKSSITSSGSGLYTLRIHLEKNTRTVEFVANAPASVQASTFNTPLVSALNSTAPSSDIVMWGKRTISELLDGTTVNMLRQSAKLTVKKTADSDANIASIKFVNAASQGYIAAKGTAEAPTINAYTGGTTWVNLTLDTPTYLFETAAAVRSTSESERAKQPAIIVRASFSGTYYYYKLGLIQLDANNQPKDEILPMLRNHHYTFSIQKIMMAGATTEEAALKGDFMNHGLVYSLEDYTSTIYDFIAGGDIALGVCNDQTVEPTTTTLTVPAVVLSPVQTIDLSKLTVANTSGASWITNISKAEAASITATAEQTQGKQANITLTLTANSASTLDREAVITVSYLGLSRTFKIIQKGTDFKRDSSRKVTFYNGGSLVTSDYFGWLDGNVNALIAPATPLYGVKPEQNMGKVRNEGFHFSTETDAANQEYRIVKKSGDVLVSTSANVSVTDMSSYWSVKITDDNTAATTMTVRNAIIRNAQGVEIEYPIYRTGIIHKVTQSDANTYQVPEDHKLYGWFYYEVVKVGSYYVLDRNLASSNNGPFSLAAASLAHNSNSIGGYYKIKHDSKTSDIQSTICPTGFKVPSADELKALGFNMGVETSFSGESYSCAYANTASGSLISKIYLPTGGYTEGNNYKNGNHANIWSITPIAGAQGFSPTSPEYGFWMFYLDGYGTSGSTKLLNTRFVSGGAGKMGSIYKGMPIRCIRGTGGSVTPPTPVNNDITIYFQVDDNMKTYGFGIPRVHAWISGGSNLDTWPGVQMTHETTDIYKYTFVDGKTKGTIMVMFNGSNNEDWKIFDGGTQAVDGRMYYEGGYSQYK